MARPLEWQRPSVDIFLFLSVISAGHDTTRYQADLAASAHLSYSCRTYTLTQAIEHFLALQGLTFTLLLVTCYNVLSREPLMP